MDKLTPYQREVVKQKYMDLFKKDYPIEGHCQNTNIYLLFCKWYETDNPDYLDQAVTICAYWNIPIKGLLLGHVGVLAQKRILRQIKPTKAVNKVLRDEYHYQAHFKAMCLVHWFGFSVDRAYDLIANWLDKKNKTKKSSSLQKESAAWRITNEKAMADILEFSSTYSSLPEEEKQQSIKYILEETYTDAEINPYLKGNRRD